MQKESLENGTSPDRVHAVCAVAIVWGLCLAYSLIRAPVPGPNEPHYLSKARHLWDPDWCAKDLFLESSNPHAVFYALIGWLPEQVGFETTALIGRIAATLLLAVGWVTLASSLQHSWWTVAVSMGALLAFQALGNLSGEWLVGGVEAKTFSYALAFLGWGLALRRKLVLAGACIGACFSFHPVIGGWVILATGLAWACGTIRRQQSEPAGPGSRRWAACGIAAVCMSPGLWASLPLLTHGNSSEADLLQVSERLSHHLDPQEFAVEAWRYYGLLLVIWGLLTWIDRLQNSRGAEGLNPSAQGRGNITFLRRIVAASALFAIAGVWIAWDVWPLLDLLDDERRAWLLKFYPFRLVDVLLPTIVALEFGRAIAQVSSRRVLAPVAIIIASGLPLLVTWRMPYADRPASQMAAAQEADWRDICRWIKENTPEDAILWAANERWAIKWFAERAEYVNYKDFPQDGPGILEWERRTRELVRWYREAYGDHHFTRSDLERLHEQTGITHLLWSRAEAMPADVELLYQKGDFNLYDLSNL